MSKNPVIVFEGIEGTGKSFHISNVARYLKKKKISFIKIREPGGCPSAEKIRNLILHNKSNFHKNTDLLLYMAARNENIQILRKYYKKKIILIDRFIDSTVAYQHYGMKIDISLINKINNFLLKNFKVDFTFLHVVNQNNMIKRLKKRKKLNRYDKFNSKFYLKVQNGFLKIAKKKKNSYKIIDSNNEIKINKQIILDKIKQLIK